MARIGSFVFGGVVGALAALLYAPRKGEETRALVSEKVNAVWGEAKDWGASASTNAQAAYQDAQERGAAVIQDLAGKGQEFAQNAQAKGAEFAQNAQAKGAEFYDAAAGRVQDAASAVSDAVKPVFDDSNDDLRDKIEAARQRIAAQVVKNAEETEGQAHGEDADQTDDAGAHARSDKGADE